MPSQRLGDDVQDGGGVDWSDFAAQSQYWQHTGSEQPGDLSRNGIVDLVDLGLLIGDWLEETIWR